MIRINLIPENLRKARGGLYEQVLGDVPKEVALGVVGLIFGCMLFLHMTLGAVGILHFLKYRQIEAQWNELAPDKKAVDAVMKETVSLQKKMATLRDITSAGTVSWAALLKEISRSVRKDSWLRQVSYKDGLLIIEGSVISKTKGEMIAASNIASLLKNKPMFDKYFASIDIESIQRREGPALSVADFVLKAKRK